VRAAEHELAALDEPLVKRRVAADDTDAEARTGSIPDVGGSRENADSRAPGAGTGVALGHVNAIAVG
jgi:hypothetical protein